MIILIYFQGIPIPVIVQLFHEALHESIKIFEEIQIPLQQVKRHFSGLRLGSGASEKVELLGKELGSITEEAVCFVNNSVSKDTCVNVPKNAKDRDIDISSSHNHEVDNNASGCGEENDEFDACFDDLPINTSDCITKSSACHSSSISSQKRLEKPKLCANSNKAELKKTEEMLEKLSFLGLNPKCKQTKRNHTQIIFGSRNLVPETPKTARNSINLHMESNTTATCDFDLQNREDVELLGRVLSHGNREMTLTIDAIFPQIPQKKLEKFEVDKNCIHIETECGPSNEHSQIIDGILMKINSTTLKLPKLQANAVIVNGDITKEFRHAGYKDSFKVKQAYGKEDYQTGCHQENQNWFSEIIKVIKTMKVGLIFCRGNIDKDVEEFCQAYHIITINKISPKLLQLLSTFLGANIVVYMTDIKLSDISRPVSLHRWVPLRKKASETSYITVKPYSSTNAAWHAKTVLLCSPTQQLLMESELAFWRCVSCVQNSINHGCVLPGKGMAELKCIKKLRQIAGRDLSLICMIILGNLLGFELNICI